MRDACEYLRALVEKGLLQPSGEKRGRYYTRAGPLIEIDRPLRARRTMRSGDDPFVLAAEALDPTPGLIVEAEPRPGTA